jgi:hypothetical protein
MIQTNYVDDLVETLSDDGLTQELRDLMYDDVQFLSDLGVDNDRRRNLAFYLDLFFNDLCEEFDYSTKNKKSVITQAFEYLKDLEDIDLTKIRAAVLRSLRNLEKVAYPNTFGVSETNAKPERNIDLWVKSLREIYRAMKEGESRESAFNRITEEWSPMAKYDFEAWARYYEKGDHEKYNIKTAGPLDWLPTSLLDENVVPEPVVKPQKTSEDFKKSLIGRLNSAERLLANFVHVWPDDVVNRLHQGLSDLKREILMMRTASSMQDRIIRMASIWELNGFYEGAEELRKIAQPPGTDITTEIEKALTGREFEGKPAEEEIPDLSDIPGTEVPGAEMPGEAASPGEAEMPPEDLGGPPAGVEETLPPPETPPGPEKKEVPRENPYASATVQDVLEILEPLSQKLREREFIRDLSKVDMMLDALNIASHFPELGEAQAKALELNIYVGTRIEKVISKLKGGLKEEAEEEEETQPPGVEMGELGGGPTEETAFEVVEEGGPAPEAPAPEAPAPEAPAPEAPAPPPLER